MGFDSFTDSWQVVLDMENGEVHTLPFGFELIEDATRMALGILDSLRLSRQYLGGLSIDEEA